MRIPMTRSTLIAVVLSGIVLMYLFLNPGTSAPPGFARTYFEICGAGCLIALFIHYLKTDKT